MPLRSAVCLVMFSDVSGYAIVRSTDKDGTGGGKSRHKHQHLYTTFSLVLCADNTFVTSWNARKYNTPHPFSVSFQWQSLVDTSEKPRLSLVNTLFSPTLFPL